MSSANAPKRWLVQFAYDGAAFWGWARQPRRRTVEGEILAGLTRTGLASRTALRSVGVASRTDRGVHARGNALVLSSNLAGTALLRVLNGVAPDIFFTKCVEVPVAFPVRQASQRWYRYFEPGEGRDVERWRAAGQLFVGPLDARALGRRLAGDQPVTRGVDRLEVTVRPPWLVVDVRAPSFVWGMVRRIIAALRAVDSGRLSRATLERRLSAGEPLGVALAEPERLVLWEVSYPFPWTTTADRWHRRQVSYLQRERARAALRGEILEGLQATPGAPRRSGPEGGYGMLAEIDPLTPLLP